MRYNSPIKLIYPDRRVDLKPSPTEVYEAIRQAEHAGARLTLKRADGRYMRLKNQAGAGFKVLVKDGSVKRHFVSQIESLTVVVASRLMLSYLQDDAAWETMIHWRPYTAESVRHPTVRLTRRARLFEWHGRHLFISEHWALITAGVFFHLCMVAVFLLNQGNAFQNIDLAKSLACIGMVCLCLSMFTRE